METTNLVTLNPEEFGLTATEAKTVEQAFTPMLAKMVELETEFNTVIQSVKDGVEPDHCDEAKALRLKYVKVRTGTAEIHKTTKKYHLLAGKFIYGWKNAQLLGSVGKEDALKAIELHFERLEEQRIIDLQAGREAELTKIGVTGVEHMNLGLMPDDVWDNFFTGMEMKVQAEKDAVEKAEADRLAAIEAERVRQLERDEEDARLRKELAERQEEIQAEQDKSDKAEREMAELREQRGREQMQQFDKEEELARLRLLNKRAQEELARKERQIEEAKAEIAQVDTRNHAQPRAVETTSTLFDDEGEFFDSFITNLLGVCDRYSFGKDTYFASVHSMLKDHLRNVRHN